MELRQLLYFLSLAELGSFRLASERVHVTQQAVSKSIAQLEARIGARLFERDGRRVRLTPVGELLLPHARQITAELKHFEHEHDAYRGSRSGRLAIGSTPTLLGSVVPEVLRGLHRKHPRLVIAVMSGDWNVLSERLLRGELDVVISTEPVGPVPEDLQVEKLCDEYNVVLAARDHPLAGTRPTARQLHRASWVGIDRLPRAEADLRRYFAAARLKPPIPRIRTEVTAFARAWVEATDFLCVLPSRAVRKSMKQLNLTTLDVTLSETPWSLVAAHRGRAIRTPAMVAFLDALRVALREPPRSLR